MKKARTAIFLMLMALAIGGVRGQRPAAGEGGGRGVAASRIHRAQHPVKNQYIVVLKDDVGEWEVEQRANEIAWAHGAAVHSYYKYAIKGFAVELNERAAEAITRHPLVAYVEENDLGEPAGTQTPAPSWGLDRIDQRYLPLNQTYYSLGDGTGVKAIVIDTGINFNHQDFTGRVNFTLSRNYAPNENGMIDVNNIMDCNGHGTGVSSVLGGKTYGVAKNVTLVMLRIGDCRGMGDVWRKLDALNYVAQIADSVKPAVVNYSWNNTKTTDPNDPVTSIGSSVLTIINKGITFVNSAGNFNTDARNYTPSYLDAALVAGASDINDSRAIFSSTSASNYGTSVDMYAPGKDITCADRLSNTGTQIRSGTSFAAPHVAGAAAIYLQSSRYSTPAQVADYLRYKATALVTNVPLGTSRLLYTGPVTARAIFPWPWQLAADFQAGRGARSGG